MKEKMPYYRDLQERHGEDFVRWWLETGDRTRKTCFIMPREELQVQFNTTFEFKTAYQVVLCSVLEQVEKFDATGYKVDGATDCEIYFEESLRFHKGAWVVTEDYYNTMEGCDFFFGMLLQLGGDHLMPKRPRELRDVAAKAKAAAEGPNDSDDEAGK